ncbi:MAG: ribosomal RNA small subunit methyltransferase A [Verrucomicrobia bacterium]|jgi:16S rRNA (adenine1518-N6/adenine1519-N6)-dimethyltransferase|nr:ribosomal RNA small subunit methyltransferase A [Verrucomicrobiota bacterium]|tara:strand:+ start:5649 stop:6998 length:1350 start_codon:yes stop_codon:yes gene_type:complete
MTGQEIREVLDGARVFPSKQLGQNFLTDPNMARWIVSQLEISPEDTVVEVGPGTGALTEHVIGKAKHVVLIEFDGRLAGALSERYKDRDDVEIHHADGAKFDRRILFKHRPVKFLGNLPYSSGGAIMKNMLGRPHPFSRAVIMLQKEVIDRLGAGPGTKDYGILSLRMQVNWHVQPSRIVPPEAFYPRPNIDSAVAVLTPREDPAAPTFDARLFDELIRRGFAQRRKQIRKQLPPTPPWEEVAEKLGFSPSARGEELDLEKWISLTRAYDTHPLKDNPQKDDELFDVVDENDVPTGTATRAKVHAENLIHRAVHVFVLNKNGDLYLQKRSLRKDKNPGVWDSSVSGHLDAGEDYLPAAIRELGEEVGIHDATSENLEHVLSLPPTVETGWEHVRLFITRHTGSISWPAAEVDSVMPFPLDEIKAWTEAKPDDFSPVFLMMFRGYLSQQA